MSPPTGPYAGRDIVFATRHSKEHLARAEFAEILGARIIAPAELDTDQFGTFAGDVPRTLTPRDAARAKAHLGIQTAGLSAALASEGSFATTYGWTTVNRELVLFLDSERHLELIETATSAFPLPPGRQIHTPTQAVSYANRIGFPRQGIILQAVHPDRTWAHKDFANADELALTAETLLRHDTRVQILPDYRAHRSPARAETIRALCTRMAKRLATPCPACHTPGYGQVDIIAGLPCALCGTNTRKPIADRYGCGKCETTETRPRTDTHADPQHCDHCNP